MRARLEPVVGAASWPPAQNLHCTLKFIGSVSDEAVVPNLATAVRAAVGEERAFETSLSGLGAFPSARRARILWAGLSDDDGALARLAAATDEACASLGIAREDRPFVPHVTLARLRTARAVELDADLAGVGFGVDEVVLFRSSLGRGPGRSSRYDAIERFPLRAR